MRRLVSLAAVLVLALGLAACGGSSEPEAAADVSSTQGLRGQELFPGPNAGRGAGNLVPDDNVVGGGTASIENLPWTVAVYQSFYPEDNWCGGVLIDPTTVLTAAHCVDITDVLEKPAFAGAGVVEVIPGQTRLDLQTAKRVAVERVRIAAAWDGVGYEWDFAILDLASPIDQNPVKLPSPGDFSLWQREAVVIAAGWGCERKEDLQPGEACETPGGSPLKVAAQTVQDPAVCPNMDLETGLCLASETSTSTTCSGDSGGPHVVHGDDDLYYLVGLVSYGPVNCRPGGYDVAAFVPRILFDSTHLRDDVDYLECTVNVCPLPSRAS